MNREIKFRAWDGKFMHYEADIVNGKHFIDGFNLESVLMQYTGLKDKNGKEIYEGDICKLFSCNRQIEFQEGSFGYMTELNNENASFIHISNHNLGWVNGESNKIEVIGNIYENPELLNP